MCTHVRPQHGFTMIEIIIVVVMLGILASVALPKILAPNERIRAGEATHILTALMMAQKGYALENNGAYAAAVGSLDITIPTSVNFSAPLVYNDATKVASIARCTVAGAGCSAPGLAYTLYINDSGSITCGPDVAKCAGVCRGGGLACN